MGKTEGIFDEATRGPAIGHSAGHWLGVVGYQQGPWQALGLWSAEK